jgi:hypothetical protein
LIRKIEINRKYIFWCILYGIIIVFGGQIFIHFLYKDLSKKNNNFINDEINSEKIIAIDTLHFTPGKGYYNEMKLSNSKSYPLFLENYDDEKLIAVNSIIQKKSKATEFEIINSSKIKKFKISSLISGEITLRLFILLGTLAVAISTFFKYGVKRDRK